MVGGRIACARDCRPRECQNLLATLESIGGILGQPSHDFGEVIGPQAVPGERPGLCRQLGDPRLSELVGLLGLARQRGHRAKRGLPASQAVPIGRHRQAFACEREILVGQEIAVTEHRRMELVRQKA